MQVIQTRDTIESGTKLEFIVGIATVIGLVLTYLQYQKSRSSDEVRLKVVPVLTYGAGALAGRNSIAIEVTNLSGFSIVIKEVGFFLSDSNRRLALIEPILLDRGSFPRTLESRTSFTAHFSEGAHLRPEMAGVSCAYATTACGTTVKGTSKALKAVVEHVRLSQLQAGA